MVTSVKRGARALGVAESFTGDRSTLCGAVTSTVGVVDGFAFTTCTVGGLDVTEAVVRLWDEAGREDIQLLLLNGVALAWYNIVDLHELADRVPVPMLALTFEASDGLEDDIRANFSGAAAETRLARYQSLPERMSTEVGGAEVFVRALNAEHLDIGATLSAFTHGGRRPEPIRVARLAARAADRWRRRTDDAP